MADPFVPGHKYTRPNILRLLEIEPIPKGGNWFTGYHCHNGEFYLFVTVGAPGRTGHKYANRWLSSGEFEWYGKGQNRLGQPEAQSMIEAGRIVRLFTREADREPFEYHGQVTAANSFDEMPFRVHWRIT